VYRVLDKANLKCKNVSWQQEWGILLGIAVYYRGGFYHGVAGGNRELGPT